MARSNGHSQEGAVPVGGAVRAMTVGAIGELAQMLEAADDPHSVLELRERMAEIELALEDVGWLRMGAESAGELSRGGLRRLTTICRQLYLKHPLINHAVNIKTNYVWGQGVAVEAKAADVNRVVQAWWDLKENKAELTGHRARMLKERELELAGNIFLALFTEPTRGTVKVRSIDPDEVEAIISNPEDRREPWFYHRKWRGRSNYDPAVGMSMDIKTEQAYYPDWLYRPDTKPESVNGIPVKWDAPVYHMKVGGLDNMRFGVPEIFPAIDWARAVQADLEQYATVRKAYAKFAFNLTLKGRQGVIARAQEKLATTVGLDTSGGEHNPPPVDGSTWIQREGQAKLEPIRTAGMQPTPDDGRRLGLMAGAGLGLPETMLWGDSTVGNYATAKSLDRPTELMMMARQQDWVDTFTDLLNYVVDATALAPRGTLLRGKAVVDEYSGVKQVQVMAKGKGTVLDRRVDINYPSILQHDSREEVQAIATAATLNGGTLASLIDPKTVARLLLVALHVPNVDEVLQRTHPDEPNPPAPTPSVPPVPVPALTDPTPAPPALPPPADTVAAKAAYQQIASVVDALGRIPVPKDVDVPALVTQLAEALRPNLEPFVEVLAKQAEATAALAARPIAVDVKLPPPAPPRKVVRETKFKADDKGHITGKTETETEGA